MNVNGRDITRFLPPAKAGLESMNNQFRGLCVTHLPPATVSHSHAMKTAALDNLLSQHESLQIWNEIIESASQRSRPDDEMHAEA